MTTIADDPYAAMPWRAHYASTTPWTIDATRLPTLDVMCMQTCEAYPWRIAFREDSGRQLTYGELRAAALGLCAWLRDQGAAGGVPIALLMPNALAFPVVMLAAFCSGCIVTCINPMYTAREVLHQLEDSGARLMLTLDTMAPVVAQIRQTAPELRIVVASSEDPLGPPGVDAHRWSELCASTLDVILRTPPQSHYVSRVKPDDIAVLQYTGGTTGLAKGAMLTHRNLAASTALMRAWNMPWLTRGDSEMQTLMLTALPLYHIYALSCCFLLSMRMASTSYIVRNPRETGVIVDALAKEKFHLLWGVNSTYASILRNPKSVGIDFSDLRISIGGGSAIQRATALAWHRLTGCHVIEGFGMSETSSCIMLNLPEAGDFTGSVGYPLPSYEVSIRTADNLPVAPGESGEACVRSPTVMAGYWHKPEETRASFTPDGFFRTGDVAVITPDGVFTIVDRIKDMILVSGFNVYPNEVEGVLSMHPDVLEVAVVGTPDAQSGERVVAHVVARRPDLSAGELVEFARALLTGYKTPREIIFHQELPKSAVGKVLRRELRTSPMSTTAASKKPR